MDTMLRQALTEGAGPKYQRVTEALAGAIEAGELKPGTKLPPVRDLAWKLDITPGTVARAFKELAARGLVETGVGRGTFVALRTTPLFEDIWSREAAGLDASAPPHPDQDSGPIRLLAPRLPDVGQVEALRSAMVKAAQMPAERFLNYPNRATQRGLQEVALDLLGDFSLGPVSAEDIVLTHGGQNAIGLVLRTILKGPDPVILVEELSYSGFRRAAEGLRARVVPVPMDEQGAEPEALEALARQHSAQVFCTMPEVHNPTCLTTPQARREEIARVAGRLGLQVLQDDCYRMGHPRGVGYRAMLPELGWHVSSVSKLLTPALRLGFAIAPTGRTAALRRSAEFDFFGLSQPLTEAARIYLSDPRRHSFMEAARARMSDYVRIAVNILGRFDLRWRDDVPFLWLDLPVGWRAASFCQAAEVQGVQVRSADEFALRDGAAPSAVRIAMNAQVPLDRFAAAIERLAWLLDNPPEQISV